MTYNIENIATKISSSQEGEFLIPVPELASLLKELLSAKYIIDVSYRSFADRICGPWRDALVEHWQEHAKEERDMAYDLAMKIMALGFDPSISNLYIPQCLPDFENLGLCLAKQELTAIETGRKIIKLCGENDTLRILIEEHIMKDQQHLDDLRRMINVNF